MSGGSMDYLYNKVEDAQFIPNTSERKAFVTHLKLVAKALHDIEWVDSGDCSPGDDAKAIRACLQPGAVLSAIVEEAKRVRNELTAALAKQP